MVRLFCICVVVLLPVLAGAAFGEGTYQRTKDGKTIVWNNDPKPGDAATWFGDRDGEGYATKIGSLTWYTANGAVYARYFGNMVRGKLDGRVNVHSKGKTDHAIFVDGQRTTRWMAGRAPSLRMAKSRTPPAKPAMKIAEAGQAERPKPNLEGVREQAVQRPTGDTAVKELSVQRPRPAKPAPPPPERPAVAEPEAPAEGPPTVTEAGNAQRSTSNVQRPTEGTAAKERSLQRTPPAKPAATAEPASVGPSGVAEMEGPADAPPAVREAESAQRSTSNVQRPTENVAAKEVPPQQNFPPTPAATAEPAFAGASAVAEPEAPAEGPPAVRKAGNVQHATPNAQRPIEDAAADKPPVGRNAESAQPPTAISESFREQAAQPPMEDTPSVLIQPSKESGPTPPTSKKSQAEVEDSLQSLARPPSSLQPIPETARSPAASPRLTKEEVIKLANAEARTHGYNRADYQKAEPQYNAAYRIWSVSYEQGAADGMEDASKRFSVIVDDKTKGTVFVLSK
jgi:hypothetical protein